MLGLSNPYREGVMDIIEARVKILEITKEIFIQKGGAVLPGSSDSNQYH